MDGYFWEIMKRGNTGNHGREGFGNRGIGSVGEMVFTVNDKLVNLRVECGADLPDISAELDDAFSLGDAGNLESRAGEPVGDCLDV